MEGYEDFKAYTTKIVHIWQFNLMQRYFSLPLFITCHWFLINVRHWENFSSKNILLIMTSWKTFCMTNLTSLLVFRWSLGSCKGLISPEKRWQSAQSLFLYLIDHSFKDTIYSRMNDSEENGYNIWQNEDLINSFCLMNQLQMSIYWIENMIDFQLRQKQRLKSF